MFFFFFYQLANEKFSFTLRYNRNKELLFFFKNVLHKSVSNIYLSAFFFMTLNRELQNEEQTVVSNRRALHEYFILEHYEAGIALQGTEVKSLRAGKASLQESYVAIENGEAWLLHAHINPFDFGNINNHEPKRKRKLLLTKRELFKLANKTDAQGFTIIPLRIYFKAGKAKVEIAVARGKHHFDKRHAIKEREVERDIRRKFAN